MTKTLPPATLYLAGPTGVGKTEVAVLVAEKLGAEIVGCDAYQIYQGLSILTAQPDEDARRRVPHHLIAEIPLSESMDVARYVALAEGRIADVHARGKPALVVGGTGMYLRALTRGLADLPSGDPTLREELERMPPEERTRRLREADPTAYAQIDLQNPRRVIRALEVCILTGRPFSDFRTEWETPPTGCRGVFLNRSREELNERINLRTLQMFQDGVLDEVAQLSAVGTTAENTLGLRQIQQLLAGEIELSSAIQQIQQATRQYAKRQVTWFRREQWMTPLDIAKDEPSVSTAERVLQAFQNPLGPA